MKLKLHNLIFVGMFVGLGVGLLLSYLGKDVRVVDGKEIETWKGWSHSVLWWLDLFGPTIFMGALKMIIAPLILASIIAGVTSLPDMKQLGSIGWKTMACYVSTTTVAVLIGLVLVLTVQPGKKGEAQRVQAVRQAKIDQIARDYEESTGESAYRENGEADPLFVEEVAKESGAGEEGSEDAARST